MLEQTVEGSRLSSVIADAPFWENREPIPSALNGDLHSMDPEPQDPLKQMG